MANQAHKHEAEVEIEATVLPLNDSDLWLAADGNYIVLPAPVFDPASANIQNAVAFKAHYDLTRKLQPVVAKAKKDNVAVSTAIATFIKTYKFETSSDSVPTVGRERIEIATALCTEHLRLRGDLTGTTEWNAAKVIATLPNYMTKYGSKVDSALRAKLASGYVPKVKSAKANDASVSTVAAVPVDDL